MTPQMSLAVPILYRQLTPFPISTLSNYRHHTPKTTRMRTTLHFTVQYTYWSTISSLYQRHIYLLFFTTRAHATGARIVHLHEYSFVYSQTSPLRMTVMSRLMNESLWVAFLLPWLDLGLPSLETAGWNWGQKAHERMRHGNHGQAQWGRLDGQIGCWLARWHFVAIENNHYHNAAYIPTQEKDYDIQDRRRREFLRLIESNFFFSRQR